MLDNNTLYLIIGGIIFACLLCGCLYKNREYFTGMDNVRNELADIDSSNIDLSTFRRFQDHQAMMQQQNMGPYMYSGTSVKAEN